jgi:hypothetical protein
VAEKSWSFNDTIQDSLNFQSRQFRDKKLPGKSQIFDLEMQSFADFFTACLGDQFYHRISWTLQKNTEFSRKMKNFNFILEIYNRSIKKLAGILLRDFREVPDIPEEFRKKIEVKNLRLGPEYFPESWKAMERQKFLKIFMDSLKFKNLANQNFQEFLKLNFEDWQEIDRKFEGCRNDNNFWILTRVFVEKFNQNFGKYQRDLPGEIIYNKWDYQGFVECPFWLTENLNIDAENCEPEQKKRRVLAAPLASQNSIDEALKRTTKCLEKVDHHIESYKNVAANTKQLSKDFDQQLNQIEANVMKIRNKFKKF